MERDILTARSRSRFKVRGIPHAHMVGGIRLIWEIPIYFSTIRLACKAAHALGSIIWIDRLPDEGDADYLSRRESKGA